MRATGRDVNIRIIRTMYRYLEHAVSQAEADRFLRAIGLDGAALTNESNWIDYGLYNRAWETLREQTGDPAIGVKVGRFNLSRLNLGSAYAVLRTAAHLGGGTAAGYRIVPRIANTLARSGSFSIDAIDRHRARLRWTQADGYPFLPVHCDYRRGFLTAGPQLGDLPPARVEDVMCIGRGDPACVYDVRYVADRAVAGVRLGVTVATAGLAAGAGGALTWPVAGLLAIAAVAVGRARDNASQLAFDTALLSEQLEEIDEAKARLQADYDALRETQDRLRHAERLAGLGELSAKVAHELRNPLGVIKGAAQVMADESKPADVRREMTTFILEEADRMNTAITNLLVFARPKPSDRAPTNVGPIIERLILEWSTQEATEVRVRFDPPPDLPRVLVDPHQLHQVLLNLILNAGEAMHGAGTVTIGAARDGERLSITVADEGPGFGPEAAARAFDPFFTTKEYGTGLGLTNVQQMIEANGGTVTIEPADGRGGRVALRLEIAPRAG